MNSGTDSDSRSTRPRQATKPAASVPPSSSYSVLLRNEPTPTQLESTATSEESSYPLSSSSSSSTASPSPRSPPLHFATQQERTEQDTPCGAQSPRVMLCRRQFLLVRHGESQTNVSGSSVHVFDPSLTRLGALQASAVFAKWSRQSSQNRRLCTATTTAAAAAEEEGRRDVATILVLTSPLTRALQTAQLAFQSSASHVPSSTSPQPCCSPSAIMVSVEDLREVVGKERIAELRRPLHQLKAQFPQVDFSTMMQANEDPMAHLAVDFAQRCAGPGERRHALESRAGRVWELLRSPELHIKSTTERQHRARQAPDGEEVVAVVSHYHLLSFLCRQIFRDAETTSATSQSVLAKLCCLENSGALEDWPNGGTLTLDCVFSFSERTDHQGRSAPFRWEITRAEISF